MKWLMLSKVPVIKLILGACAVKKCNAKVAAIVCFDSTMASHRCGISGNNGLRDLYLCERHFQEVKAMAMANDLNFEEE
ncbi:MAG: hypothetical protein BI182_15470 [Acetobacterium sp. MES1]|uniref:hypothetical protein n=1 Tax=Acetobacterium sp. MES1 TaxID=1899015 RepID=UPI000B9D288C|nr:hypothetical protein [Acetobacterium sp. MES1]OXS25352.1 MAG: hypothetical protein BI182_15470 [Acetobacterium sp. MES1]